MKQPPRVARADIAAFLSPFRFRRRFILGDRTTREYIKYHYGYPSNRADCLPRAFRVPLAYQRRVQVNCIRDDELRSTALL